MADYKLTPFGALLHNSMHIPNAPGNRDWDDFAAWQAAGNTPDPLEPDPPPTQDQIDATAARVDAEIQALAALTPAQARAFVTANVNSLADAKALLARMAAVLCVLARRI